MSRYPTPAERDQIRAAIRVAEQDRTWSPRALALLPLRDWSSPETRREWLGRYADVDPGTAR